MTEPHWDRPANSGPRPCHLMLDSPYQGSRTGLHTSDLNVRARHTPARLRLAGLRRRQQQPQAQRQLDSRSTPTSPAVSVLALKVIDSSMVSVSPDVDREGTHAHGARFGLSQWESDCEWAAFATCSPTVTGTVTTWRVYAIASWRCRRRAGRGQHVLFGRIARAVELDVLRRPLRHATDSPTRARACKITASNDLEARQKSTHRTGRLATAWWLVKPKLGCRLPDLVSRGSAHGTPYVVRPALPTHVRRFARARRLV